MAKGLETLRNEVLRRAESLGVNDDEATLKHNDIRMKAPMLFILLGDQVKAGLSEIQKAVEHNMSNSEGIVYLVVESGIRTEGVQNSNDTQDNAPYENSHSEVIYLKLGQNVTSNERGQLSNLLENHQFLMVLNQKVALAAKAIQAKNKVFSYWEQMYVSVVTGASDVINVILPDLMVLVKNKLEQSFKQVFTDLFVLLEETEADSEPFQKALSYSLFKELDFYQSVTYHYEREIELVDEEMKLMTTYKGQLFHLVYLLTDKNENGQRINEAFRTHYESIVAVNLLKNREQKSIELEEAREQFNYNTLISNIQEMTENRYCTARLAKVKKPGQGIYLAVVYHLFKAYVMELSNTGHEADRALLDICGLSEERLEQLTRRCLPEETELEQIYSLITRDVSFKHIKGETFSEAEAMLYEKLVGQFFETNFSQAAKKRMQELLNEVTLKNRLIKEVVGNPAYGPMALGQFIKSDHYTKLNSLKDKCLYQMKQYEAEIEEKSNQLVGQMVGGSFGLFDKKYLQAVKSYLVHEIYGRRYGYEVEALKVRAIELLQEGIETLNKELMARLKKLECIESFLADRIEEANRYEEEYLVQNVMAYYQKVVQDKLSELEKTKGKHFLQDEKYIGSSYKILEADEEDILNRIFKISEQEILRDETYFNLSFEEELLARANMLIEYEDTQIAAKGELYQLLYESLEENSKPPVHLDTTLSPHRYLEKYFFGNRQSEFIEYAYKRDQSSRSYKIGTVSDQRKSVIEKLQLMGGFKLDDLVYAHSAKRYYEAYREKGYAFHGKLVDKIMKGGE